MSGLRRGTAWGIPDRKALHPARPGCDPTFRPGLFPASAPTLPREAGRRNLERHGT